MSPGWLSELEPLTTDSIVMVPKQARIFFFNRLDAAMAALAVTFSHDVHGSRQLLYVTMISDFFVDFGRNVVCRHNLFVY